MKKKNQPNAIEESSNNFALPPHNLEAERRVLGAMMVSDEILGEMLEELDADAFYLESHRKIFQAIKSLFNKGKPADAVHVAQELQSQGPRVLEQIGGLAYLSDLCLEITAPSLAKSYAEIVKRNAVYRDLIKAGQQIANLGYFPPSDDPGTVIDKAESILYKVSSSRVRDRFVPLSEVIRETYDHLDRLKDQKHGITGVPTGFQELDRTLLGLQPSDLIILAARPGKGKTSFALSIARNVAVKAGFAVGIFSLEMSKLQLAQRLLSAEAMISSHAFKTGNIKKNELPELLRAIETLSAARIFIDDTPSMTVTELRTKARRLKNKEDVKLIIIDYLQLLQGDANLKDRYQQVSEISRSLKILAKELEIPVIAISQLSREIEKRKDDPRPRLSDLRESGSIEQDADVVIFLYSEKEEQRFSNDSNEIQESEIIVDIAKHRNGPTRSFKLKFISNFTKHVEPEIVESL